jgi:hypothetical protein
MRPDPEVRCRAAAHLVDHPARLLLGEVVVTAALRGGGMGQGAARELGTDHHRLEPGGERVAAEEPGERGDARVHEPLVVDGLEVPVAEGHEVVGRNVPERRDKVARGLDGRPSSPRSFSPGVAVGRRSSPAPVDPRLERRLELMRCSRGELEPEPHAVPPGGHPDVARVDLLDRRALPAIAERDPQAALHRTALVLGAIAVFEPASHVIPGGIDRAPRRSLDARLEQVDEVAAEVQLEGCHQVPHRPVRDADALMHASPDAAFDAELPGVLGQVRSRGVTARHVDAQDRGPRARRRRPATALRRGPVEPHLVVAQETRVVVPETSLGIVPDAAVHAAQEVGVALVDDDPAGLKRIDLGTAPTRGVPTAPTRGVPVRSLRLE